MGNSWNSEELSLLAKYYGLMPVAEVAQKIPTRSIESIRTKGTRMGFGKRTTPRLHTPKLEYDEPLIDEDDALADMWIKLQDFQESQFNLKTYRDSVDIHVDTDTPIILGLISDAHVGAPTGHYDELISRIDLMASTPKFYVASVGDTIDNYMPTSHASGMFNQLVPPSVQKKLVEHQYMKLKGRWLAVVQGCHDEWSYEADEFDWSEYLSSRLECPNLGFGGFVNLTVGEQTYKLHLRHKYPRYNSSFNLTHSVKRLREQMGDFDIGVIAHNHQATIEQMVCGDGVDRLFVRTGSFKGADRYSRQLGYNDTGSCIPSVILYPDERRMIPFLHLESAAIVHKSLI